MKEVKYSQYLSENRNKYSVTSLGCIIGKTSHLAVGTETSQ